VPPKIGIAALLAASVAAAALALAPSVTASDGGSGTYTVRGDKYDFVFFNSGTAPWQYFYLVGPAGTKFIGGDTSTEATPRCIVGLPNPGVDEIECGPLSANFAPPLAHLGFSATLAAPVACGSVFQLYVSSTGDTFTRGSDVTFSGSCAPAPPHAIAPPVITGRPVVGHTLVARPAVWSAEPSRVVYSWQLCTKTTCTAIKRAATLRLKLTSADRGRSVRIVATATIGPASFVSRSGKLAVRSR
jgi:hypothetical protein